MRAILTFTISVLLTAPVAAQTVTTVTGPITVTGVQGDKGDPGPPGPKGNMARGTPLKGSACMDGDSFYDYDNPTAPTKRYTWTCGPGSRWYQDTPPIAVSPW